jgi:hypothetical protein
MKSFFNTITIIILLLSLRHLQSSSNNTLEKYISEASWLLTFQKGITSLQNARTEYAQYKSLLQVANTYKIERENTEENFDNLDDNFDEREKVLYKKKANFHMQRTIIYGIKGFVAIGFCLKKSI